MDRVVEFFKSVTILNIPLFTLSIAFLIVIISLLMRKLFSHLVVNYFSRLAKKTETQLDEMLLNLIEGPLRLAMVGVGLYIARLILYDYISERLNSVFDKSFQLFFLVVLCWLIYRAADVIVQYLQRLASKTPTELDDLMLPYLRRVIRIALIILIIIKIAEIFLGMSAAALLGLLGGMGLTLGLVFKDIIANWFGCAVIYADNLFREGDWVVLNDGKVVDADVEEIGLRSTRFRNFDKTISVVPNAMIAQGVVKNWSRMFKRRVKYSFSIDGIGPDILAKILDGVRNILASDEDIHQEFHMVNFRELEGNSRIIRLYYFTKTLVWKEHEQVRENINLKILKLFEENKVDKLAYTIVDLSDDRPRDFSVNGEKNYLEENLAK